MAFLRDERKEKHKPGASFCRGDGEEKVSDEKRPPDNGATGVLS